ncbi:hypothetical protein [Polaromonas sp. YR568]|uniref:hypothetical protein n=1 Tax=Polaromonas sp. YR568 TaxID=1855301 RepID=UPI00398C21E9
MKNLISSLFGRSHHAAAPKRTPASARDNPLTIEDGSDNATRRQLVQVLLRDALRKYGIPPRWIDCQMLLVDSRSKGPGMYVRLVVRQWDDRLMNYAFAFQNALMVEITRFEPQATQWLHGISWQLDVAETCPHRELPDKSFWAEPAPAKPAAPAGRPVPPLRASRPVAPPAAATAATDPPAAQPLAQPLAQVATAPMSATTAGALAAPILASLDKLQQPHAPQAESLAPAAPDAPAPRRASTGPDSEAMKDLERLFRIRDQELGMQADSNPVPVGYEPTRPSPL